MRNTFVRSLTAAAMIAVTVSFAPRTFAAPQLADGIRPEWYRASIDSQFSFWFVDAKSIYNAGQFKRAWIAYKAGIKAGKNGLGDADVSKSLMEFDCTQRRHRVLAVRTYDRADKQLDSVDLNDTFRYIVPGTPPAELLSVVCSSRATWTKDVERVGGDDLRAYYNNWIAQAMFAQ